MKSEICNLTILQSWGGRLQFPSADAGACFFFRRLFTWRRSAVILFRAHCRRLSLASRNRFMDRWISFNHEIADARACFYFRGLLSFAVLYFCVLIVVCLYLEAIRGSTVYCIFLKKLPLGKLLKIADWLFFFLVQAAIFHKQLKGKEF